MPPCVHWDNTPTLSITNKIDLDSYTCSGIMDVWNRIWNRPSAEEKSVSNDVRQIPSESSTDGQEEETVVNTTVQPGELSFEEDTAGGLGRHLGLFSTTFLM